MTDERNETNKKIGYQKRSEENDVKNLRMDGHNDL